MHVQSNGGWLGGRLGGWLAGRPKPPPRWLAQLLGTWRANSRVGAPIWRANLARQLLSWRAPSPVLARPNCPILPVRLHPVFHLHPSCIPFAI